MGDKIGVLIDSRLVGELFDRIGPDAGGVGGYIEDVLESFLERTEYDDDMWR